MSLASIDELRTRWRNNGTLAAAEAALAVIGFDDAYVDEAIASSRPAHPKVVKDSVWGMIDVGPSALRLLDCPIVQRLRAIHQLGFSYLTYPSAEHSRFAHSLGMYGVVSRFLDIVRRRGDAGQLIGNQYRVWLPDVDHARIAEHAAILHDIGHMPFSHVTEKILQAHPNDFTCGSELLDDFLIDAEDLIRNRKLAELLSAAVVLTDRFGRFYSDYVHADAQANDTLRIASVILGRSFEPGYEGVASLISGDSIDADKIDYINRDAEACGIAVGVDVSRLFLRSQFLSVPPPEIQRLKEAQDLPAGDQIVFVVNASGIDSIEEIGQARTLLYHRVYLHQTTRNAERLLGQALELCLEDPEAFQPKVTDAFELWTSDDFELLKRLSASPSKVGKLARRLRTRDLPKRAGAFGRKFAKMLVPLKELFPDMSDADRGALIKEGVGGGLEEFRSPRLTGEKLKALENQISSEAVGLAKRLRDAGKHSPPDEVPVVSVLPITNIQQDREDCFVLENETLVHTSSSSVTDEQMDAADIAKSVGYVLTDRAWRSIVFLATRSVVYKHGHLDRQVALRPYRGIEYEVRFSTRILLDAKLVAQRVRISGDDLDNTFRRAAEVGYFDEFPRLAPVDLDANDIARAASKLEDFEGQGNWQVTPATVRSFISQFPVGLRAEALRLIEGFTVFGRTRLAQSILTGINSISLSKSGFIASLSPDSGSLVRTTLEHELSAQLAPTGWKFKKTIRDVFREAQAGDHLVLCDDNVTSGSQALVQFLAWLKVPEDQWTEEQRQERGIERSPLDERDIALLKTLKITIVVDTGTSEAGTHLRDQLIDRLGLAGFTGVVFQHPLSLAKVTTSADMESFLKGVGASVLRWCRHRARTPDEIGEDQEAACQRDCLGYGGAQATIATQMSVPAGTLTPFWAPGYFNGEPWFPLLLRRGYLPSLVLS